MRKKLILATALAAITCSARADLFVDFDPIDPSTRYLVETGRTAVEGNFNVQVGDPEEDFFVHSYGKRVGRERIGYIPGTPIVAATATFCLYDGDSGRLDEVEINLIDLVINGIQSTVLPDDQNLLGYEVFPLDLGATMIAGLLDDGSIFYQVVLHDLGPNNYDNVVVKWAQLEVITVPDGGTTLALLGLGLLGLVAIRRKAT